MSTLYKESSAESDEQQKETESRAKDKGDSENSGHGATIAAHYNTQEKGLVERNLSRIVHLRNFNNWIKGMLIKEYLDTISRGHHGMNMKALDLCCGKGGDLLKWRLGNIRHLVCCDIASVAIDNCRNRYEDFKNKSHNIFSAEFIVADATKTWIRKQYKDPSIKFDLVSCQFAFHYCFESLPQAECMMRNASECLRPGGYFIGTIPDANAIVAKQKAAKSNEFGNDVLKIRFEEETVKSYPLFGAKYHFQLDGVVDCPEFLVHFPTFEKLAAKYGLVFVKKMGFQSYFEKMIKDGKFLLNRMSGLERYPPSRDGKLAGKPQHYTHASDYMKENRNVEVLGTLSSPEWEVTSLYLVFAFQKKKEK